MGRIARRGERPDWALAGAGTRELTVLRVIEPDPDGTGPSRTEVLDGVERAVRNTRERRPGVEVTAAIIEGAAADVLRRWAVHGSLLVLGTSERMHDHVGAGLAERLALTAEGPVAVVPEGTSGRSGEVVGGIDGSSDSSAAAAEIAAAEAADRQTPLRRCTSRGHPTARRSGSEGTTPRASPGGSRRS